MNPDSPHLQLWMAIMLLAMVAVGAMDVVLDLPHGPTKTHLAIEFTFLAICLGSAVYLGTGWYRTQVFLRDAREAARQRGAERDSWRRRAHDLLEGLGAALDAQLREWELTAAEREMALFLLKGFSHREIAEMTSRSERTVRQHAVAVYRKSGLSGRAELSAFFLEDLLLPASERESASSAAHAASESPAG